MFQARIAAEAPVFVRHRDGAAVPAPVVAVQVVLLLGAVLATLDAGHTLSGGLHLLIDLPGAARSEGSGYVLLLGLGVVGLMGYFVIQVALSVWAINALHQGRALARIAVAVLPALDLLVLIAGGPVLSLTFAVHLIITGLLWLPAFSQQHFRSAFDRAV